MCSTQISVLLVCCLAYRLLVLHPTEPGIYGSSLGEICPAVGTNAACSEVIVGCKTQAEKAVATAHPDVVLDLTESFDVALSLSLLASDKDFLHMHSLRQDFHWSRSYPVWASPVFPESLVRGVFSHFGWTKAVVVGSPDPQSVQTTQNLVHISSDFAAYFFSPDVSADRTERTLAKAVKTTGRNQVLVACRPDLTVGLLRAAERRSMMKAGYAYFLMEDSIPDEEWTQEFEGVFFISPARNATVATRKSLFLSWIAECFSHSLETLPEFLQQHRDAPLLHLYNVHSSVAVLYATYSGGEIDYSGIVPVFPGSTTKPPTGVLPLLISINNSTLNPSGSVSVDLGSTIVSTLLAILHVNTKLGLLPNFELVWTGLEYGCIEFDEQWAAERLRPLLPNLGLAIINSPSSQTAIGLTNLLKKWNSTLPIVGANGSVTALSSPKDFPYYIRISLPELRLATVYCQILKYYGWTHIAVMYEPNNTATNGLYANFKSVAESTNITILNSEESRALTPGEDCSEKLTEIQNTKARIMVFLISDDGANTVLTKMYSMGVRRGDIVFFAPWVDIDMITDYHGMDRTVHQELLVGSVKPSPLNFRGSFGKSVYKSMTALGLTPRFNDCQYYDAVLTIAYTLRLLIQQGENLEDLDVTMSALRQTKFVGCSGLVYVQEGTNDRARMAFQVLNLQSYNNSFAMQQVLVFDPESTVLFQRVNTTIWPDGTKKTPSDIVSPTLCPDERHLSKFDNGQYLVLSVGFALLVLISAVTVYIWNRWWRVRYEELTGKHEMSVADFLFFTGVVVEFSQVISMGPDLSDLAAALEYVSEAMSLNLKAIISAQQGLFWIILDAIFASCGAWALFLFCTLYRVYDRLGLSTLATASELWLPLVGDVAFLPIVSQLMEIFICDRSYRNTFLSSVLANDCHYLCWGLTHSLYVGGCAAVLLLWVPFAVFTRPLWQELQPVLHVKTQPLHKLLSTIFQITLIVLNKTVKRTTPFAHNIIYILLMCAMLAWMSRFRPHNYGRVNLWHAGMYGAALWMGVMALVSDIVQAYVVMGLLLFVGWAALLVFCLLLQVTRFESHLYRKHREDLQKLFRFGFAFDPSDSMKSIEFNKPNTVRQAQMMTTCQREMTFQDEVPAACEPVLS